MPDSGGAEYRFIMPPRVVGWYRVGDLKMMQTRRPRWLTRLLMCWLVEWCWEDAPP